MASNKSSEPQLFVNKTNVSSEPKNLSRNEGPGPNQKPFSSDQPPPREPGRGTVGGMPNSSGTGAEFQRERQQQLGGEQTTSDQANSGEASKIDEQMLESEAGGHVGPKKYSEGTTRGTEATK